MDVLVHGDEYHGGLPICQYREVEDPFWVSSRFHLKLTERHFPYANEVQPMIGSEINRTGGDRKAAGGEQRRNSGRAAGNMT